MKNRFYTLMIVPEKTDQVKRLVVPAWMVRTAALGIAFVVLVTTVMFLDYWYVMNQISENKQLRLENRRLRQQVQVFKNKITTVESTMERVKTFATRLKIITNIEDQGGLLQSLNGKLPDSSQNIGKTDNPTPDSSSSSSQSNPALPISNTPPNATTATKDLVGPAPAAPVKTSATVEVHASNPSRTDGITRSEEDPEDLVLRKDYEDLDQHFSDLNRESLYVEQMLQDEYELLADQKAFLAALPTRRPAPGYYTSGFGVRSSPFGGRVKMHEGVDIANRPGTTIKATADGVVIFAGTKSGYGQTVILDHGYGLETWYGHARKLLVARGEKIKRGDSIALMGSSGRSTGPHVHYEVRVRGTPVDPLSYILEN
jgi:murein DD-endopeptidase MepM/ murein hydrolase activator NlpD